MIRKSDIEYDDTPAVTKVTLDEAMTVVFACLRELENRLNTIEQNLGLGDFQEE